MTEKRFHPFAVLHLLRKTILLYLIPLVQVLFARNWAALWAALVQDLVLFALLSAACWAVLHASGWQMDAHGNLLVRWRLGIRLDRTLRADMLAALTIDRPVVYRLAGASRLTLYPAGQKKPMTLIVARDDARELADRLLPLEQPVVHRPHGGEKMVFAVLGANGLSTLALLALALAGWVSAALPWLMSAAAGCMVCVTAQEMIPEAVEQDEPAGVISVVLGFALMMALDIAL